MVTYVGTLAADNHTGTEDIMYGLDGDDFLEVNGKSYAILYGGEGNDTLNFLDGTSSGGDIYGGSGDDFIDGDFEVAINDDMYGDEGNDTINAYGGSDSLYGGQGNDLLRAGTGSDELYGGQHDDVLDAGDDNDFLDGGEGTDRLDGGLGDDALYGGDGDDTNVEITVGTSSNVFTAGLYGGAGNDYLDGGRGNDYLDGGSENDILLGGEGNDRLIGGDGVDKLYGGTGNDKLTGNGGADALYGGENADYFIFQYVSQSTVAAGGRDTIFDFSKDEGDKIDFKSIDANTGVAGNQAFVLIGSNAFSSSAGELRFAKSLGDTFVQGDVDGDGAADFAVRVKGDFNFVAGDFVL
nr:calcium-binding protein [uncultured Shinella sp.]